MSFDNYTIVFAGLGGQGLLKLLEILGNALVVKGCNVITSETHGLSQRGGKVTCFLRFGDKLNAPIPLIGVANMIIALEESCILDVLKYANPDKSTKFVISSYEKPIIDTNYPSLDYLLSTLFGISDNIFFIPAVDIALKTTGNIKTMNSVLLGYIHKFLPLDQEILEDSISTNFSGKLMEMNLKAFNEGINL
jgi:indolepyruvate ferredoxin oxidoreductase beta subunit